MRLFRTDLALLHWNLDVTKCQETGKICSLLRGFVISRYFSGVEKIVCYTEDFVIQRFVMWRFHWGSLERLYKTLWGNTKFKNRSSLYHTHFNYGNSLSLGENWREYIQSNNFVFHSWLLTCKRGMCCCEITGGSRLHWRMAWVVECSTSLSTYKCKRSAPNVRVGHYTITQSFHLKAQAQAITITINHDQVFLAIARTVQANVCEF